MLVVAEGLRQAGDAQAALDVLERAIDHYPVEPAIYAALVPVLNDLGRGADASLAAGLAENS
jgi:hypothetical protein